MGKEPNQSDNKDPSEEILRPKDVAQLIRTTVQDAAVVVALFVVAIVVALWISRDEAVTAVAMWICCPLTLGVILTGITAANLRSDLVFLMIKYPAGVPAGEVARIIKAHRSDVAAFIESVVQRLHKGDT